VLSTHALRRRLLPLLAVPILALALLTVRANEAPAVVRTVSMTVSNSQIPNGYVFFSLNWYRSSKTLTIPVGYPRHISASPYAVWKDSTHTTCLVFRNWLYGDQFTSKAIVYPTMTFDFTPVTSSTWAMLETVYTPSQWYNYECLFSLNSQAETEAYYNSHNRQQARIPGATQPAAG